MLVDDADAVLLKKWVVKRLEDISDADSDVLADYVLALVRSEDPDEQVKSNCLENLEDFLRDRNVASSSFKCAALTLLI
ncbi:CCCH zinc finger and RRM domain-containing protein [Neofusicoccum parvum]|uniref:CCCH zinc finger and RRM domain-containing protein n=1 Tax=Neofusicoccum parvum TaxID=310453 RepID=A0ACB5RTE0_9PEZI|nr:CCCH zinc finger and RRM domain-containing protein [Neofusicoccum parvum]GME42146.1 CCCH zinc finger and RRM domain-containing protein [Neofusicoccum parvum]